MNEPAFLVFLNLLCLALGTVVLYILKGLQFDVRDLRAGIYASSKETDQKIDTSEQKIFRVIESLRAEMKEDMKVMSKKIDALEHGGGYGRGNS